MWWVGHVPLNVKNLVSTKMEANIHQIPSFSQKTSIFPGRTQPPDPFHTLPSWPSHVPPPPLSIILAQPKDVISVSLTLRNAVKIIN